LYALAAVTVVSWANQQAYDTPFLRPIDTVCGGSGSLTSDGKNPPNPARFASRPLLFSVYLSKSITRTVLGLAMDMEKKPLTHAFCSLYEYGLAGFFLVFSRCADVVVFLSHGKAISMSWVLLVFFNLLFACLLSDYKDREHMADGFLV
jgi:hypothetical protein